MAEHDPTTPDTAAPLSGRQWRWSAHGRDAIARASHSVDYEDHGVVSAEHPGQAVELVARTIAWLAVDADHPLTITIAPVASEPS